MKRLDLLTLLYVMVRYIFVKLILVILYKKMKTYFKNYLNNSKYLLHHVIPYDWTM